MSEKQFFKQFKGSLKWILVEQAVSPMFLLSAELDGTGQFLEGLFSDKEGLCWELVRCISMLSGVADGINPCPVCPQ